MEETGRNGEEMERTLVWGHRGASGYAPENTMAALEAKFIPTLKNRQVADFYDRLGFSVMRVEEGVKYYMANIDKLDLSIPDYYSITVKQ